MQQREPSASQSYFWPVLLAVGLHLVIFATLFVSFSSVPKLPPSRPIVQVELYQLNSQSQATAQTNQKIAGDAQKTAAQQYEIEQLAQRKREQERQALAAKAAEQKKAEEARKAEQARQAAEAKRKQEADAAKAAEQKRQAELALKKAEDEKKKAAEEAARKKKAAEAEAKKKQAADEARKKAADEAKRKQAAEEAAKKASAEKARKADEERKAQALAELLSDDTRRQQAVADTVGDKVAGSLDDLIVSLVSQQWRRPPSARNGMSVEVLIQMLPDGTITNATVKRSSGDAPFDQSAVAAVRNVGRIPEMQQLDRATFDRMYRQRAMIFKPEDLGL